MTTGRINQIAVVRADYYATRTKNARGRRNQALFLGTPACAAVGRTKAAQQYSRHEKKQWGFSIRKEKLQCRTFLTLGYQRVYNTKHLLSRVRRYETCVVELTARPVSKTLELLNRTLQTPTHNQTTGTKPSRASGPNKLTGGRCSFE